MLLDSAFSPQYKASLPVWNSSWVVNGTKIAVDDVAKLSGILHKLVEGGNTVVVIEHNLDIIKTADYIIDMGPEGGDGGGTVIAQGTPEEIATEHASYTGYYIDKMLRRDRERQLREADLPG